MTDHSDENKPLQGDGVTPVSRLGNTEEVKLDASQEPPVDIDLKDIWPALQMIPEKAEIWFGGRRMVLSDNNDLGVLRVELIQALGADRAHAIMSRIGYELGTKEAELALKVRADRDLYDVYSAGPQFHAIKGIVRVETKKFEFNPKTGKFFGEYYWHNSAECAAHLQHMGVSHEPGGWQSIGYASGYSTAILGRPIIYREQRCIAMGHEVCHLIGRCAEDWDEPEAEMKWFRADTYHRRPGKNGKAGEVPDDLKFGNRDMVGASAGFNVVLHLIDKVASTDAPVLFLGESGVGKEVFARELHKRSSRSEQVFVAINCAAIPETLLESELFGVVKGAYTGASVSREGRFERANGGTLFLDEIGTLSLAAQGKLLRVLQEHEFEKVGGTEVKIADVRIIAATNSNLREEINQNKFREDLFYRLNVFPVQIPPLRNRRTDIPLLINYFLKKYCKKHKISPLYFSDEAIRSMLSYEWPGNIRELENIVERSVIVAAGSDTPISISHLVMSASSGMEWGGNGKPEFGYGDPFRDYLTQHHKIDHSSVIGQQLLESGMSSQQVLDSMISAALESCEGNVSEAARVTGMTRSQVNYWLKRNQK